MDTLKGGQEARESSRDFLGGAWGGFGSTRLQGLLGSADMATVAWLNKGDDTFNGSIQIKDENFSYVFAAHIHIISYHINHYQLHLIYVQAKGLNFWKRRGQNIDKEDA